MQGVEKVSVNAAFVGHELSDLSLAPADACSIRLSSPFVFFASECAAQRVCFREESKRHPASAGLAAQRFSTSVSLSNRCA